MSEDDSRNSDAQNRPDRNRVGCASFIMKSNYIPSPSRDELGSRFSRKHAGSKLLPLDIRRSAPPSSIRKQANLVRHARMAGTRHKRVLQGLQ